MAALAQPGQQSARAATQVEHARAGRNQFQNRVVIQAVMVEDASGAVGAGTRRLRRHRRYLFRLPSGGCSRLAKNAAINSP